MDRRVVCGLGVVCRFMLYLAVLEVMSEMQVACILVVLAGRVWLRFLVV